MARPLHTLNWINRLMAFDIACSKIITYKESYNIWIGSNLGHLEHNIDRCVDTDFQAEHKITVIVVNIYYLLLIKII